MKKISLIFSADYDFQIIRIVLGDSTKAWDIEKIIRICIF
jgi:hypothetical protein